MSHELLWGNQSLGHREENDATSQAMGFAEEGKLD